MCEGWPVKQTGTKLSVVVNGELYAFDPSNYVDSGRIKVYDQGEDAIYLLLMNEIIVFI